MCCSCSSSSSNIGPTKIHHQGTFAEKAGMALTKVVSELFNAGKWAATQIGSAILFTADKIEDSKTIQRGFYKVERFVVDWIFSPMRKSLEKIYTKIKRVDFTPLIKKIQDAFNFAWVKTAFVRKALNEWVFKPIFEAGKKVYNAAKPHIVKGSKSLYTNVLKPAFIKSRPYMEKAGKTLTDWVFKPIYRHALKPFFTQCFYFINGIYRQAVIGPEISEGELEEILKDIDLVSVLENKESVKKFYRKSSKIYSCRIRNAAIALYLKRNDNNLIVARKWVEQKRLSFRLVGMI